MRCVITTQAHDQAGKGSMKCFEIFLFNRIKVKEFQRSFRHSDTELLSQSDKVLKLKNFKKDAALKLSKSTNQESSRSHSYIQVNGTSSSLKSMITTSIHKLMNEVKDYELKTNGYLRLDSQAYTSRILQSLSKPDRVYIFTIRNFMFVEDDEDLSFLPQNLVIHTGSVAARIKDRKYSTRGSLKLPVKRRLVQAISSSRATRQKVSPSKSDSPFLTISDDEEDVLELQDATACHLKIFNITPLGWKGHLDNQLDAELLDLYDQCYDRQAIIDNVVN
ncbi:hypothetical protein Tco_1124036 [Tanacetum coccineum]|uniref:Uncharacterized protein n=1 Tax=Tanacetum coccineum TaxID=301880 RepID=A0ABQ5J5M1_9ASTR